MATLPFAFAFQPHEKIRDGFCPPDWGDFGPGRDLTRSRESADELIHEGRLLIKRARALLWFARPALGPAAHTRTRARLRKAAGLLADQRDLAVTRTTLEQLARKAPSRARDRAALAQIFRSLVLSSTAGGAFEKALRQMLQKAMGILRRSVAEIKRSATGRAAWPVLPSAWRMHFARRAGPGRKRGARGKTPIFTSGEKRRRGFCTNWS